MQSEQVMKIDQKGEGHFFTFKKMRINRFTKNNLVTETLPPFGVGRSLQITGKVFPLLFIIVQKPKW